MTFLETLDAVVSLLGEMEADEDAISELSYAQATLFHGAVMALRNLEDDLVEAA